MRKYFLARASKNYACKFLRPDTDETQRAEIGSLLVPESIAISGEELDRNKTLQELGIDHCTMIDIQQDE